MALSSEVTSLFAKTVVTEEKKQTESKTPSVLNGTIVGDSGSTYVRIDGSDQLTPIDTTSRIKNGQRVTVMIKNHSAIVTGNLTAPSANQGDLDDLGSKIDEFDNIIADVVTTEQLEAVNANIEKLMADDVVIRNTLTATEANIKKLTSENVTITGKLEAAEGKIDSLDTEKLDVEVADIKFATIENLEATNADIHNLEADYGDFKVLTAEKLKVQDASIETLKAEKVSIKDLEANYANIDFANIGSAAIENFFSKSGMIGDLVVGDGTITGTLVGVTIKGDLIEGGTVKADKLVVQGEDGLYYKLNVSGETVSTEQTEYNSLNGSIITAKSITAEKVNVNDLVAFGATIGGFTITEDALYSGVKESPNNATRGTYMDSDGQFSVGDAFNYVKFFKDENGKYKLDISASSISFGVKNIQDYISEEVKNEVSSADLNIEIGGRNYVVMTKSDPETVNGITVDHDDETFHIYGTNTMTTEDYEIGFWIARSDIYKPGEKYSLSIDTPIPDGLYLTNKSRNSDGGLIDFDGYLYGPDTSKTFTIPAESNGDVVGRFGIKKELTTPIDVRVRIKLERGNSVTDWTPAPEDVASDIHDAQNDANFAKDTATSNADRIGIAESSIKMLDRSIQTLVSDADGDSLMTQTSDGWTFNIGAIQKSVDDTSKEVDDINKNLTDTNEKIAGIDNSISELAKKTAYIVLTVDEEGNPCIELGKEDNPFKVRITNTAVDFMEGSSKIAYVNNQTLNIERAIVKNELQIGEGAGFIWQKRSNGNLGLQCLKV